MSAKLTCFVHSLRSLPTAGSKSGRTQSEQVAQWQHYRRKLVSFSVASILLCGLYSSSNDQADFMDVRVNKSRLGGVGGPKP